MEYLEEEREIERIESKIAQDYENKMLARGLVRCNECDEWAEEEDLSHGLCEQCVKDIINNVSLEDVMDYATRLSEEDELVLYTEYLFKKHEAIGILKQQVRRIKSDFLFKKEIVNYINNDVSDYLDYLESKGEL